MKSILLAMTFRNGVRVSRGKRWGGIGLSVVIFIMVVVITGGGGYSLIANIVAVYAFWVLWRHTYGKPHEFWKHSETDTPQAVEVTGRPAVDTAHQPITIQAVEVTGSPAIDTAQQPITIIIQKKSSTATWVLVIIVLLVIGVVALGGCSLVMVPG